MLSNNQFVIAVDGGGSKTMAAICDQNGLIQSIAIGDSSNIQSRPWNEVEQTLYELLQRLIQDVPESKGNLALILFGLAGADRPDAKKLIGESFGRKMNCPIHVDNDAVTALYSGTWGKPGTVLIAGTGSIAYSVTEEGIRRRIGGWGYLLGDEGSGFDLGRKAIISVLREFDGRGKKTLLTDKLLQYYCLSSPPEFISFIYGADNPRKKIAEASPILLEAAVQGDEIAIGIVDQAIEELSGLARGNEKGSSDRQALVLAGGLLTSNHFIQKKLLEKWDGEVIVPIVPPVVGGLVMALMLQGIQINENTRNNLSKSWMEKG